MASEIPEVTRRPSNLSRKALDVAKEQAKLAGTSMTAWITIAVLEKAAREKTALPSTTSSLTEEMLQPLGRPPNLSANILQTAKIQAAIAGKTIAVWLSEAMFEKAERDSGSEGSTPASKKLVHA